MQKYKQQNSCKIAQHVKTILTMIYWLVASCLSKMIYKVEYMLTDTKLIKVCIASLQYSR